MTMGCPHCHLTNCAHTMPYRLKLPFRGEPQVKSRAARQAKLALELEVCRYFMYFTYLLYIAGTMQK